MWPALLFHVNKAQVFLQEETGINGPKAGCIVVSYIANELKKGIISNIFAAWNGSDM